MTFHLHKHLFFVSAHAHTFQLADSRDFVFSVVVLRGNPQGRATDELVVLLEDDAFGRVAIDEVEGEMEGFRGHAELRMDLDQKVD